MTPVFLAIAVLVGGALVVAVMQNKKDKAEAAAAIQETEQRRNGTQTSNPFADRDNSPKRRGGKRATATTAPPGLAQTEVWTNAKKMADQGIALVKEATAARKTGDEDTFRAKGAEGRDLLDEALMQTGDWILDLLAEHPDDGQVDKLSRERGKWQDAYKKVRKI